MLSNRWINRQSAKKKPFGASSFDFVNQSRKGDYRENMAVDEMHELSCLTDDEQRLQVGQSVRQFFEFSAFLYYCSCLHISDWIFWRVYMFYNKAHDNNNFPEFCFDRNSWSTLAWRHLLRTLRRMNPAITSSTRYHPRLTPNLGTSVSRTKPGYTATRTAWRTDGPTKRVVKSHRTRLKKKSKGRKTNWQSKM